MMTPEREYTEYEKRIFLLEEKLRNAICASVEIKRDDDSVNKVLEEWRAEWDSPDCPHGRKLSTAE